VPAQETIVAAALRRERRTGHRLCPPDRNVREAHRRQMAGGKTSRTAQEPGVGSSCPVVWLTEAERPRAASPASRAWGGPNRRPESNRYRADAIRACRSEERRV